MIYDSALFRDEEPEGFKLYTTPEEVGIMKVLLARISESDRGEDAAGFMQAYREVNQVILDRSAYFDGGEWEEEWAVNS